MAVGRAQRDVSPEITARGTCQRDGLVLLVRGIFMQRPNRGMAISENVRSPKDQARAKGHQRRLEA